VNLEDATRQKARQLELPFEGRGEAPRAERSGEASTAAHGNERSGNDDTRLMERVVERGNVIVALKRVQKNKGSPGIDGMTVEALRVHLRETWPVLREQLLAGTYKPQPVKRQLIPKGDGGERELGIPTALDRFIQQALLQVLEPQFDPTFSSHSHGFRPGRRAHDAVCEAQRYIQEGRRWVVDVDLEKFFNRVNHDLLMGRLARRMADKRALGLIRGYLDAGVMAAWIRHRLRALQLKHWKNESTVYRELRARGLSELKADKVARNTKSWWRNSGLDISIALPASHFDSLGVPRLAV
jgi:hypothetical protein